MMSQRLNGSAPESSQYATARQAEIDPLEPIDSTREVHIVTNSETLAIKIDKQNDSAQDLSRQSSKKDDAHKTDKKLQAKKPKHYIQDFSEFIPEFLLLLCTQKQRSIIRIGRDYQADVPQRCAYSHRYRPLGQLKVWTPGEFQNSVLKKFKEKFGDNRTEEDLCHLMYQYQCDWNEISTYIAEYKGELRKSYLQRDRNKL